MVKYNGKNHLIIIIHCFELFFNVGFMSGMDTIVHNKTNILANIIRYDRIHLGEEVT